MEIVVVFSLIQSTFYRVVLNGFRWYVFIYMVHCVCWFSLQALGLLVALGPISKYDSSLGSSVWGGYVFR